MASAGVVSLLHYPIILTALAMDRPTGRAPSDRNMAASRFRQDSPDWTTLRFNPV